MAFGKKRKASSGPKPTPQIIEKFNAMTPKKRAMVLIVIIVVVGGAFAWFYAKPKFDQINKLEVNLSGLEKQLATAKRNAAEIDVIKQQVKEAEEAFNQERKALPETEEIPVLLTSISKAGQEENLQFILFAPQKETVFDFYAEIPVQIEIIGEYHDIARFFSKLANFPRIVVIRDISIKPYADAGGRGRSQQTKTSYSRPGFSLSVTCIASTYKFTDQPLPEKNTKKK